jgi:MtN3 and saliva related transmembrane protein
MDYIQLVGIGAAVLTTLASIPQAYKIIKEKNTEGVSTYTYSVLMTGTSLWVVYGIMNHDWPVIVANAITALVSLIIILLNLTSRKVIKRIHEAILPREIKKKQRKTAANSKS